MNKFSVFANFFIDTNERFERLKDSFFSFNKANINEWLINIRGDYKYDVQKFLNQNVKENLKIFFLESNEGWIEDSLEIIKNNNSDIIFFWIEDHICIANFSKINSVVNEMYENKIDHLTYSFFHKGILLDPLEAIEYEKKKEINFFTYNFENYNKIKNWYKKEDIAPEYLISCCSFMSIELFKKNLLESRKKNKYNKMLPFNFEKSFSESEILPFKNAVLNEEMFVSIDDDNGERGYCLINRGKYPNRVSKKEMENIRKSKIKVFGQGFFSKIINKFFKS
tara:strand:- start:32 stop:874 length:843 start_codon:yes stop_codon:yes gene_type:complete